MCVKTFGGPIDELKCKEQREEKEEEVDFENSSGEELLDEQFGRASQACP